MDTIGTTQTSTRQEPLRDDKGSVVDADYNPIMQTVTETAVVPSVRCARLAGHDGDHTGYGFHITHPETWHNNLDDPIDLDDDLDDPNTLPADVARTPSATCKP